MTTTTRTTLVIFSCLAVLLMVAAEPDKPVEETPEDGEDQTKGPCIQPVGSPESFEIDNQIVAKTFGWDIKQTRQHMHNQKAFGNLMVRLNEQHSTVLAGSAMARNPGEAARIWFKGPAPTDINEQINDFMKEYGMLVKVIDNMRFSMEDQEKRMDELASLLERRGFQGAGAATLPGDIIQVTLPASTRFPETPKPSQPSEQVAKVDKVAEELLDGMDVYGIQIVFTTEPIDIDHHARGGRMTYTDTNPDGTIGICTSGFSVYRISDGKNGISIAAHCTGMVNFDAESPEADFDLFHKGEHCGSHGDLEWKSSNHVEPAEYWANVGDKRNVNSVENWYANNNVYCVYSRMQGTRTCDRVYSHSVNQYGCSALGGVTAKRLVAMDNDNTVGGDSGGPYSYSTEAVGAVKGSKTIWFNRRGTFTKASRFDEALGVRIKTK